MSWTDGGVIMGTRVRAQVALHVADAARERELTELLSARVGMQLVNGVPSAETGVALRVTTAPPCDNVMNVIPVTPAS